MLALDQARVSQQSQLTLNRTYARSHGALELPEVEVLVRTTVQQRQHIAPHRAKEQACDSVWMGRCTHMGYKCNRLDYTRQ